MNSITNLHSLSKWAARLSFALLTLCCAAMLVAGCSRHVKLSRLTLLITGNTMSYLKNCGCSNEQYGGQVRRQRLIKEEREVARKSRPPDMGRPAEAIVLDCGNFSDPRDPIHQLLSQGIVEAYSLLGFQSVGLGKFELQYKQVDLWNLLKDAKLPINTANLRFVAPAEGENNSAELNALIKPYIVAKLASGYRVGIIHVIGSYVKRSVPEANGYELSDPVACAQNIIKEHLKEADYWILTAADIEHDTSEAQGLGKIGELMQVIGIANSNPLQTPESKKVQFPYFAGEPYLKSKDLMRSETFFNEDGSPGVIDVQRLAIRDTIKPDEDVQKIIDRLQIQMEKLENERYSASQPLTHPIYLGQESCKECHKISYDLMLKTDHQNAYKVLVEKGKGDEKSADCLRCHVLGHPNFAGNTGKWSGGWNVVQKQQGMASVQCESCHGPGEYHVLAERAKKGEGKTPDALIAQGRDEFGMIPANRQTCLLCHDEMNDPDFDYDKLWPKIEHQEPKK